MEVNELSVLAEYYGRGEISAATLRDEVATDEMYCDFGDTDREIQIVFASINAKLIAGNYIEATEGYKSGIGPEAYKITDYGIKELKKEVDALQRGREHQPPMAEQVEKAINEANAMLTAAHLPRLDDPSMQRAEHPVSPRQAYEPAEPESAGSRGIIWYIAAAICLLAVVFIIDMLTGAHLVNTLFPLLKK